MIEEDAMIGQSGTGNRQLFDHRLLAPSYYFPAANLTSSFSPCSISPNLVSFALEDQLKQP
jgi:hypothetical protein